MKESDIRPADLFDRYLALCRKDAESFFLESDWVDVQCPACGAGGSEAFVKHGFSYRLCETCDTLYASPRPTREALDRYYRESESVRFWATDFYRETEEARRERMFRPRARLVLDTVTAEVQLPIEAVFDIGAGYGVFCEEVRALLPEAAICAIEPSPQLAAVCRAKGFDVVESFLETLTPDELPTQEGLRVFTSFELLEHLFDPQAFLRSVFHLMRPGDLLVLTTLSGIGFDIRVLWERAKAVFPPHHLNFLNPGSLGEVASRCGFEVLNLATPGKLDVDIVGNSLNEAMDRFVRVIYDHVDDRGRDAFQRWLQDNRLSSHMMMLAARRDGDAG